MWHDCFSDHLDSTASRDGGREQEPGASRSVQSKMPRIDTVKISPLLYVYG